MPNNDGIKLLFFVLLLFTLKSTKAQFSGSPGTPNSTAIYKDSSVIIAWAKHCIVQRGYLNIQNPDSGFVTTGLDSNGTGKAGSNPIVSLGDGGSAILTFYSPIKNGDGFDFVVFENSFSDYFLELAFVEVSSDGLNYFRFPATSLTQFEKQIGPFDLKSESEKINNLAGKYRALYGTPFDLEDLKDKIGLDVDFITHIKLIDVIGSIQSNIASYDQYNHPINDPYPTPFPSGGFDLDAIGVINQQEIGLDHNQNFFNLIVAPNPTDSWLEIKTFKKHSINEVELIDLNGITLFKTKELKINLSYYEKGIYFLKLIDFDGEVSFVKLLKI